MEFTYAQLAKLMLDNHAGKVSVPTNFSAEDAKTPNEAISDAFYTILGVSKETATVEKINLAFRNESVRNGVYAVVEEVVKEGIISESWRNPFFDRFVESKVQNRGDKTSFYIESRKELVVSRISKDGRVALDRQRFDEGEDLEVKVETFGIKVYEHLARILTGRGDWNGLVARLYEAVEKFIAEKTYAQFDTVCSNLPTAFKHSGSYNRKTLVKTIANVKKASGAKSVTLVGTGVALQFLEDADYASEATKNELHQTGRLGKWFGNSIIELPNAYKQGGFNPTSENGGESILRDDVIYIVPDTVGQPIKLVTEPQLMDVANSSLVRADDTIELAVRFGLGMVCVTGGMLGTIAVV